MATHLPDCEDICWLLAGAERLRVVAALALGADRVEQVAERAGLPPRQAGAALARLTAGGLVERTAGGGLRLRAEVFAAAVRAAALKATGDTVAAHEGAGPEQAAVLRTFLPAGKLVSLPAAWHKRRVVLEHLAQDFEPGVRYHEREVNEILRGRCARPSEAGGGNPPDHVTLRRLLVDEGLLTRDAGIYWRTGGPVEV